MTGKGAAAIVALGLIVVFFILRSPTCSKAVVKPVNMDGAAKVDESLTPYEKLEKELEDLYERKEKVEKLLKAKIKAGESGADVRPDLEKTEKRIEEVKEKLRTMRENVFD